MDHDDLRQRLRWLVRLRWTGIVAVFVAVHVVRASAVLTFPLGPVYVILGSVAIYNIAISLRISGSGDPLRLAVVQIVLDQLALAAAVYFSGGADSPLIYFFIFHVVISGTLLPGKHAYLVGALAVVFPAVVLALKSAGVLPHYGIFRGGPLLPDDRAVVASYGSVYIGTVGLTAYFVNYLSSRLHDSRAALQRSNEKLQTLLDASRLTTETLQMDEVLASSLRILVNVANARAGAALLLDDTLRRRCSEYFSCMARHCPAHAAASDCWLMTGTRCQDNGTPCGQQKDLTENPKAPAGAGEAGDEKIRTCVNCELFSTLTLQVRAVVGDDREKWRNGSVTVGSGPFHRSILLGRATVEMGDDLPGRFSFPVRTSVFLPLMIKGRIFGVYFLASDALMRYQQEDVEYFQYLTDVVSSGVLNSKLYGDMEDSYLQTVMAMENAVEAQDPYTRGHSTRVAGLCTILADALRLEEAERDRLRFAALLHDAGKIGISRRILRKPGALNAKEELEMRMHCNLGAQILGPVRFLQPVLSSIRHHHENFDGTGYPDGLRQQDIPLLARIIKVADAWDAMCSDRPYRKALSGEAARQELLRYSGTQFDPHIVAVFLSIV